MLFWIMLGLVVVLTVGVYIWQATEWDWVDALLPAFLTAIFSFLGAALVMFTVGSLWMKPYVLDQHENTYELRALSNSETVEGQFRGGLFVSSGYIDGKQVFSYIQSEGEGYVLRQFDAEDAVIYQGDYDPSVEITTYRWGNPWFWPWDRGTTESAEFYVPEGSVANTYEVAP